jgi:hypothetical protein
MYQRERIARISSVGRAKLDAPAIAVAEHVERSPDHTVLAGLRGDVRSKCCRGGLGTQGSPTATARPRSFAPRPASLTYRVSAAKRIDEGHGGDTIARYTAATPAAATRQSKRSANWRA